jgi:membrane protein DedA with SNARE-associated domain
MDLFTFIEKLYLSWGLPLVFLSGLIEISPFGWMIPGGSIIAVAGFFSYGRSAYLLSVLIFSWFGAWSTFLFAYLMGAKTGDYLINKLGQQKAAKRAEKLLVEHGPVILTTSMLANLTRFWIAYIAGQQKYKFSKFFLYSGIASLAWTSLLVIIGYLAGAEREKLEEGIARLGILAWLLFILAVGIIYWKGKEEIKDVKK